MIVRICRAILHLTGNLCEFAIFRAPFQVCSSLLWSFGACDTAYHACEETADKLDLVVVAKWTFSNHLTERPVPELNRRRGLVV